MQNLPTRLSEDMRIVMETAQKEAARRHAPYLDVEHLLMGLFRHTSGPANTLFKAHHINTHELYDEVARTVGMERPDSIHVRDVTREARQALDRAAQEATEMGHTTVNSGHLLLGLMVDQPPGIVSDILNRLPLTADVVRETVKLQGNATPAAATVRQNPPPGFATTTDTPAGTNHTPAREPDEVILVPFRPKKKRPLRQPAAAQRLGNWPLILLALAAFVAYMVFAMPGSDAFIFLVVLIGWVFSVTLHEFAHALVAYLGGDYTVKDKGYLSFNPLKYAHPMLSIGLPLLFLAMGGIGLPGGAVYIERHRLKNKWWGAAVSAAGPAANLVLALVLSLPFLFGLVDERQIVMEIVGRPLPNADIWGDATLWMAVAVLITLQVTAVLFNLLPVPPLDGFGIIEPFLDPRTRWQFRQIGAFSLLFVFLLLWTPLGDGFWDMIYSLTDVLHVPDWLISEGFRSFMFWQTN